MDMEIIGYAANELNSLKTGPCYHNSFKDKNNIELGECNECPLQKRLITDTLNFFGARIYRNGFCGNRAVAEIAVFKENDTVTINEIKKTIKTSGKEKNLFKCSAHIKTIGPLEKIKLTYPKDIFGKAVKIVE